MQLHPHPINGGIGVQHFVLDTLAFIDDHHVRSAFMISQSIGNARHLITERAMQRKEMVDLRVEGGWGGIG